MPSVPGHRAVGSLPGVDGLLPMSPAPEWTEAHTQCHHHLLVLLRGIPGEESRRNSPGHKSGALGRENHCPEIIPVSPQGADPRISSPVGGTSCVGLVLSQAVCAAALSCMERVQGTWGSCLAADCQADLTDSNRKVLVGELIVQPNCSPSVSLTGV